jgi:hypothetical protein
MGLENQDRKVFCIGFNKTGTSSLHRFFKESGLTSTHNVKWPLYSKLPEIDKGFFRQQCYSDGELADFVALDRAFAGSLFILNNRDLRAWLYSRIKHVMRFNESVDLDRLLVAKKYGKMAREFYFDEEAAIKKWIYERRVYLAQVRKYFEKRSDFIEIDITTLENWEEKLRQFFADNAFPLSSSNEELDIHRNKRSADGLADQALLKKYEQLMDDILSQCN